MCVYKLVKALFFTFNVIFWAAGCTLLGVSIWLLVDDDVSETVEVAGVSIYTGSYVLVAAGALMFVVGFAGCCGAMKNSTLLLGIYFGFLFVIFGLQIGISIWAFVEYGSLEEAVEEGLKETADLEPIEGNTAYKNIQQSFKCCGVSTVCEGFTKDIYKGCGCTDTSDKNCGIPPTGSTCPAPGDSGTDTAVSNIYLTPCDEAVYDFIDSNMLLVAGIALAIGLAEILGMLIACCLCNKIKEKGDI